MHDCDGIALDHLDRMTDSTGLIQHAIYGVPRRESRQRGPIGTVEEIRRQGAPGAAFAAFARLRDRQGQWYQRRIGLCGRAVSAVVR